MKTAKISDRALASSFSTVQYNPDRCFFFQEGNKINELQKLQMYHKTTVAPSFHSNSIALGVASPW
jgi:hypothetical protein